eukprot:gene10417-25194_t
MLLFLTACLAGGPPKPPTPGIAFNFSFGDTMVLQQSPQKACVYGTIADAGATGATVKITSSADAAFEAYSYELDATVTSRAPDASLWKACLQPQATGGDFSITATCTGCSNGNTSTYVSSIEHVTFGDVWYCGGQSNMALPLMHTMSRNISRDLILGGKYDNIRIHGIAGNMNPEQPWTTLKAAIATNPDSDKSAFGGFSSTCYYYGESLSDELAKTSADGKAPPIGLIHTAFGGSSIEQWLSNETIATCSQAAQSSSNQMWHDARVLPYIGTTVKGWVWYQGENDMHNFFGNSALKSGATAGTTDADAPFGIVTLAPSGTEGGSDIGTMRWAQTAGFGMAPNSALQNVFVAQAYDLNDPYRNDSCYGAFKCHDNSVAPPGGYGKGCDGYCASVKTTNWYMGPIHPRDKKPVGARLAATSMAVAYKAKGFFSNGPTVAGCSMNGGKITVFFNKTMMAEGGADAITIQPYYKPPPSSPPISLSSSAAGLHGKPKPSTILKTGSKMEVLINATEFCMQTSGGKGGSACRDDGTGKFINETGFGDMNWVTVDIAAGSNPNEVVVDLSRTKGVAYGIRYGWTGDCCDAIPKTSDPCPIASCPIMGSTSNLPANPFVAHIVGGKCKCLAPQTCNE